MQENSIEPPSLLGYSTLPKKVETLRNSVRKVSAQEYFVCQVTIDLTFENLAQRLKL
jgi:septation ring formation regulator EzrA